MSRISFSVARRFQGGKKQGNRYSLCCPEVTKVWQSGELFSLTASGIWRKTYELLKTVTLIVRIGHQSIARRTVIVEYVRTMITYSTICMKKFRNVYRVTAVDNFYLRTYISKPAKRKEILVKKRVSNYGICTSETFSRSVIFNIRRRIECYTLGKVSSRSEITHFSVSDNIV